MENVLIFPRFPPHKAPRIESHQHGEIQPAFAGVASHVRDVAHPFVIRAHGRDVPLQVVGGHPLWRARPWPPILATVDAPQPVQPHQPGHVMSADANPSGLEFPMQTRTPIPSSKFLITRAQVCPQPVIRSIAGTLGVPTPGIEPTASDGPDPTPHLDRILRLLRLNEAIPQADSLAKKAAALFRMSRSIRSRSTSRRNCLSSSAA